jgi:hypothetical protein
MKQHIFSQTGRLLILFSMFLSFFACQQDQVIETSPPSGSATFKKSAKQFYEFTLANLRKSNIDPAKTHARFTALDLTPDWDNAIDYNKNGRNFSEIPVTFAGNGTMSKSASGTATQFDSQTAIPVPARLIISQSEQGSFEAHIMIIESTIRFPNGIVPEFNLFKKIDNFTGREILCHLDGSFYKGWRHEKGQIVSSLSLDGANSRQQPLGLRSCW